MFRPLPWLALLLLSASGGCHGIAGVEYRELVDAGVCAPGAGRCDADMHRRCSADGTHWEDDPCTALRPHCVEDACICIDGADPDDDDDACTVNKCVDGDLQSVHTVEAGDPCELWQGNPEESSCARDADGGVRCWGRNEYGQLGHGASDDKPHTTPQQVPIPPVRRLALGASFACALLRDGNVECWGKNDFGQARGAAGGAAGSPVPIALPGPSRRIATGAQHACALLQDGTVRCWGRNESGQIGDGTQTDPSGPVAVHADASRLLTGVVELSLGSSTSCALREIGDVWCWGSAIALGIGAGNNDPNVPYPIRILGGVKALSVGVDHTCVILQGDAGQVACWGLDINGETGDPHHPGGVNHDVTLFPYIRVGTAGALLVTAAFRHTCAALPDSVVCWGGDFWGQLGDGADCVDEECTHGSHTLPRPVQSIGPIDGLAAGFLHTCAIANGAISCWGVNKWGQLGDGSIFGASIPTSVIWH